MRIRQTILPASLVIALPLAHALAQPAPGAGAKAAPASPSATANAAPAATPSAAPTASAAAESDPMSEKARELFNEGKKLFRDGKYGQAEAAFEAAWALALQSKGIAANLGEAELRLGKHREAAEHLTISLRLAPPNDPLRARTAANLAQAKAKVGTLVVKANMAGAEVLVDGKKVGEAPLADPIYVEPGKRKVRVRLEGYASWEKELDVTAGQEVPLDATLDRVVVAAPTASATVTASAALTVVPVTPRSKVPAFVMGGVAVVGAAVGAGLLVSSRDKYDATQKISNDIVAQKKSCVPGAANYDSRCPNVEKEGRAVNVPRDAGIASFVVAGAAAAGAAIYLLWPTPGAKDHALRAFPIASDTTAGFMLSGRF